MNEPIPALIRRMLESHAQRRPLMACLVVGSRGSTPQSPGALMLVDDAMNTFGTIGGGCIEAEVRSRAFALLPTQRSQLAEFKLDHDYGWDDGLICGGTIRILLAAPPPMDVLRHALESIENRSPALLTFDLNDGDNRERYTLRLAPPEALHIAGAGHVGQALARIALTLGFSPIIYDDRGDVLELCRIPGLTLVQGDIADSLRSARITPDDFAVVVTRGHKHDEQALGAIVGRGARYVGMIGSRRKVKLIFDDLRAQGCADEELRSVHAPIGLPINAVTVEEIAVSIAAQLVQVRREGSTPVVEGPLPLSIERDVGLSVHS